MADRRTMIWATICLDVFLWGLIFNLFGPSSLRIMATFKIDFVTAGFSVAAVSFGAMFSMFTGRYADKYGAYQVSRLSLLFLGLLTFIIGFSNSIFMFIILSFLTGICNGTFQASFYQIILDLYPEAKLKMLGFTEVFFGIGSTIGPTATALIISGFDDWKIAYMLFGGILAVSIVFQFYIKQSRIPREIFSDGKGIKENSFFILVVALFFMFIIGTGVGSWLPTYVVTTNRAGYLEASALLSCFWATGTVMRGLCYKIVEKVGEKKTLVYFISVCLVFTLISIGIVGFVPNAFIWGIVGLVYVPLYPLVMLVVYSKYKSNPGRAVGRLVTIANFGALIAAPLIGTINNVSGPDIATLVVPLSGLIVLLMFLKLSID
jgi:FHS family L-fucose permease-like MFS transporter